MSADDGPSDPAVAPGYLPGWWQYLRGPGRYLSPLDLGTKSNAKLARKNLVLGLLGVIAMSAVNVRIARSVIAEEVKAAFDGRVLAYVLLQGCILFVVLTHVVLRATALAKWTTRTGGVRQAATAFALSYGYLWPSSTLALILIAWVIRWTLGLDWTALPPFIGVTRGTTEASFATALFGGLAAALYCWLIGWVAYCYVRTTMRVYAVRWWWALGVVAVVVTALYFATDLLAPVLLGIAQILDPLISWFLRILG